VLSSALKDRELLVLALVLQRLHCAALPAYIVHLLALNGYSLLVPHSTVQRVVMMIPYILMPSRAAEVQPCCLFLCPVTFTCPQGLLKYNMQRGVVVIPKVSCVT
jgi:hypothetical protein